MDLLTGFMATLWTSHRLSSPQQPLDTASEVCHLGDLAMLGTVACINKTLWLDTDKRSGSQNPKVWSEH